MNIFKLAGEKFKKASKKEQKKICAASFLTVLAAVICITFLFWNEICYFISPSWHLGNITKHTIHKINEEQSYVSNRLFGFDITNEDYQIELNADAYLNRKKQSISLSVSPGKENMYVGLTTAINDVPVLQTAAHWDDSALAFSFPQINNKRYYVPVQNIKQTFADTPLEKSLPFTLPEHIDSLSYTKIMRTDENTKDTAKHAYKQFLKSLLYEKREKTTMQLNGKECSVHVIRTECSAQSLADFASSLHLLYTDGVLKNTAVDRTLSDICAKLKQNAQTNKTLSLDLIERNSYLIGFKTDTLTFYFHSGLLLNGFTLEAYGQSFTVNGDIQMQGGVMDFTLTRATLTEPEKLAGAYLDRRAGKLLFDTPYGTISFNVRCADEENPFALYENTVYYNNEFVDFSVQVKPGRTEIPMGETDVLLTEKPYTEWEKILYTDINRLLRDTTVFKFLFQK